MNILKIKRALAELVWTGALLFAAASVFLRPGAAAGGVLRGAIKSSVGMGVLLSEGIGDTLRVSLTADPVE